MQEKRAANPSASVASCYLKLTMKNKPIYGIIFTPNLPPDTGIHKKQNYFHDFFFIEFWSLKSRQDNNITNNLHVLG